jgi:hypothetical protein
MDRRARLRGIRGRQDNRRLGLPAHYGVPLTEADDLVTAVTALTNPRQKPTWLPGTFFPEIGKCRKMIGKS